MRNKGIKLVLVFVNLLQFLKLSPNRDICKVRKIQHQYPKFGHTEGEIKKLPAKKNNGIQGGVGETQKTINIGQLTQKKRLFLLGQLN
jgi:hypothetical protein